MPPTLALSRILAAAATGLILAGGIRAAAAASAETAPVGAAGFRAGFENVLGSARLTDQTEPAASSQNHVFNAPLSSPRWLTQTYVSRSPNLDDPVYLNVSASEPEWSGHVSYVAGYKRLESKWGAAAEQVEFGFVDLDLCPPKWPISLAAQFLASYSGATPPGAEGNFSGTYEFNLGLRKVFKTGSSLEPFIGGGLAIVGTTTTTRIGDYGYYQHDSAAGVGFWAGAGFYWNFAGNWHLGFELQYSYGQVDLLGGTFNAGGLQPLIMVGVHW